MSIYTQNAIFIKKLRVVGSSKAGYKCKKDVRHLDKVIPKVIEWKEMQLDTKYHKSGNFYVKKLS